MRIPGISHPVAMYRVVDLHANLVARSGVIRTDLPHLKLEANIGRMSPKERERAARTLREALARLEAPSTAAQTVSEPEPMGMDA